ncbi:hypothetical protein EU527_11325 [Candidatus Thorarchaeota archaeon]|nr:MAG: hypothetical protein EU527_11325 [Candidatus Thorarchaeota archaeon]
MTEESETSIHRSEDYINLGSMFRSSATITFVIQIVAVIIMLGSLTAYYIGDVFLALANDIQILVLLLASIVTLIIFLAAISVFVRFSRRIGDAVVGPGIEEVKMNTPRVKAVVGLYGILVALMGVTGLYAWYLVDSNFLAAWAISHDSESLRIFGIALGAFVIALLIQIIIAGVGRSATKIIIEVLDADDSEFID